MNQRHLGIWLLACFLLPYSAAGDPRTNSLLLIANQMEHSVLLVDPMSKQVLLSTCLTRLPVAYLFSGTRLPKIAFRSDVS
jgi:hypothetical protein